MRHSDEDSDKDSMVRMTWERQCDRENYDKGPYLQRERDKDCDKYCVM